ncbi:putative chromatin regulator PHD family [Lupinus albus]|uniref:Putative chromatin regulator PHD family n=1 Tax=Lupinus albus TaxID=3870 RepID=A0A6A4QVL4_LUPAL|nr:putative chromatin regulator PHD family [Lupinus albus]
MNLPPINSTPNTTAAVATKASCSNCNLNQRWLLHRVLYRGTNRLLCTSCVLCLHPSSFCHTCLEFFEHPLSSTSLNRFISCIKCSSLTHLRCLPSSSPPPSSFLCPSCSSPDFKFFNPNNAHHVFDKKHALVFLCAAKIASASVAKALSIARAKADRSVRDSAAARKRAREALLRVDNLQRLKGSIQVSGSCNLGTTNQKVQVNHSVVCKKEELNGQNNKVRVSSAALPSPVPLPQYGSSVTVKNNGAPHSVIRVQIDKSSNCL